MDKGLKNGKMCQMMAIEECPSPRQAVQAYQYQWDSVESDTESLAQERAYQQQLQKSIGQQQNTYTLFQKEKSDSSQYEDREEKDANNDDTEDLQVYDSLEVYAHPHAKRNAHLLQPEYLVTQIDEKEGTSQLLSDEAYSDLRYDPNWRTNLRGADRFNESQQISVEEYYQVPKNKSTQACSDRQGLVIKKGYRYIVDTSPAVVVTPHMDGDESDQPYRLHPQESQTSSVTAPCCHNQAFQLSSPADLSRPFNIFTKNESDDTLPGGFRDKCKNSCDDAGEDISSSPELTKNTRGMHIQEFQTYYQQELRHTQGALTQMEKSTIPLTSSKVSSRKKLDTLSEDIVRRNKMTLGCHTSKCGSYVALYALKQEMPHNVSKVHKALKETASTQSPQDSSDSKMRELHKAQELKPQVTQISRGKKAQRKEYPNPPQQQQPPAPGVRAEWGDCLSSPLARPNAVTQPKPQKTTSAQPLPPTIHLNINLNASSDFLPLLQQKGQDAVISVTSLQGCPNWSPASEAELALPLKYQQTNLGKSSQIFWKGVQAQPHHQNLDSIPVERTTSLKWPSPYEGDHQRWSPNEIHNEQFLQNVPGTPTTISSLGSGNYTVLPPIGKPVTGKGLEPSSGQCVNTTYPIHRSSSDGYLVQMERQKQLGARVTYKAYSLKDYKQLKTDVHLRGLGPDYTLTEKTKMKRQRLYSNVIREQNKKISRIPFLPAKDPEGNNKKVPRMKALEYAKTIAKPPVQPQPKQRMKLQSEDFTELAPLLEGLDMSQPATLEVLRKRHEEEKQAVALFRKVHAV